MPYKLYAPGQYQGNTVQDRESLIFPAVAAIHGIVLAIVHVDSTYENTGLLSLLVEFFRATHSPCTHDDDGNPIDPNDLYGFLNGNATCNLTCSITAGPFSPLRKNATDEIFVIPIPTKLTFNTGILLAAACCIPAVLSLVSMWNKILEINWKSRFGPGDGDELIEGTNGATVAKMTGVNAMVKLFLSTLEIPILSAAVLAILVFGELNLWSIQVLWQTEPIASIGQWAPIVGTVLAALGSLYVLLSVDMNAINRGETPEAFTHHCHCAHHHYNGDPYPSPRTRTYSSGGSVDAESTHGGASDYVQHDSRNTPPMQELNNGGLFIDPSHPITTPSPARIRSSSSNSRGQSPTEIPSTTKPPDIGGRRTVYNALLKISTYLGTANKSQFDDSEFKHGKALGWPEIPAEEQRNPGLPQIREVYNQHREDELAELTRRPRAGSFAPSVTSRGSIEDHPISRAISAPHSHSRAPSPSPSIGVLRHASTLPIGQRSSRVQDLASSSAGQNRGRTRERSDTLTVPEIDIHHGHAWSIRSASSASPTTPVAPIEPPNIIDNGRGSPAIIISADPDTNSVFEEPAALDHSHTHTPPEPATQQTKSPPLPT
ncbi:hypothetical protein ABKA04_007229 [Annulohypoxylon sp. FPYF3050]